MPIFNAADLVRMRATQVAHMQDECVIGRFSITPNSMNEQVRTITYELTPTTCGLDMRTGIERHSAQFTTLTYDASVRLPITVTVDKKDQIKITKRFGETLAVPLIYEIVGPIQRGPSGIRLLLKKVEL
jgi:hypothetical protein